MKEGTISVLFGCHSIIHSILVYISWIKLYKTIPSFKETVCILIHDIGHIGLDYLSDYEQKKKHWILGSNLAKQLFGDTEYQLVAGHDKNSGIKKSILYNADKYSWVIAPKVWLYSNWLVEKNIRRSKNMFDDVNLFKNDVIKNYNNGFTKSTHEIFLEQKA